MFAKVFHAGWYGSISGENKMAQRYLILTQRFVLGMGLVLVLFNLAFSAEFKPLVLPEISKEMEMKLKKGSKVEKKISGLLEMQIQLRNSYRKQPTSERLDAMRGMGMKVVEAEIDRQMIFIHVKRKLTQSRIASLKKLGVKVYEDTWIPPLKNHPTGFVIASMPVNRLYDLARKTYVLRLETAEQRLEPLNDKAAISIHANNVWDDYGYSGAGVRIAVLDSGLDTTHGDIPTPIESKDYSNFPSLDDTISDVTGSGHGTHVTGSVLGRGTQSSGNYKGMAYGADLIFLKIQKDNGSVTAIAMINAIKDAVDKYNADIITMSYKLPDIIYNDGSDEVCHTIDDAFENGALVFIAAGNEAAKKQHYSGTVTANSTTSYYITVNKAATYNMISPEFRLIWFDGVGASTDLDLEIWQYDYFGWFDITSYFNNFQETESEKGTESRLLKCNYSYSSASTFYLFVTNNSNTDQFFHVYSLPLDIPPSVTFEDADPNYTVTSQAVADNAIAVGSYVTRTNWYNYQNFYYGNEDIDFPNDMTIGAISSFSSRGPRIDGIKKPDTATPGQAIISVWDINENKSTYKSWIDSDGNNDGNGPANYLVMQGTSMACPIAAGAAALLMQAMPSLKGNPSQARDALFQTASNGGTQDNTFGYGKMDIQSALNYVLSTRSE